MEYEQLLALSIFSSYFLLILALFYTVFASLPRPDTAHSRKAQVHTFKALTVFSFAHTWFYMFRFMMWSFRNYEGSLTTHDEYFLGRMTHWLVDTGLFEQAWSAVCSHPMNWWWSEQLCLFTVGAWTVFLVVEGRRHAIKHLWAYMLLGQLVAISVASNIFYLALSLSPSSKKTRPSVSPGVWMSVTCSLITIGIAPFTTDRTFLPNLLIMHVLLVIPLIPSKTLELGSRTSVSLRTLYRVAMLFAIALRTRSTIAALSSLPADSRSPVAFIASAWATLHSHPAQSSIGWDVVWTTLSFIVWNVLGAEETWRWKRIPALVFATTLGSVGVSAPYVLQRDMDSGTELKSH